MLTHLIEKTRKSKRFMSVYSLNMPLQIQNAKLPSKLQEVPRADFLKSHIILTNRKFRGFNYFHILIMKTKGTAQCPFLQKMFNMFFSSSMAS